jgi:DNA-binding transcriptional regulator YiaG
MTGAQLREAQRAMQLTNQQLCRKLGVAETTLCNWKAGRIEVPTSVGLAMRYLLEKNNSGHRV